MHRFIFVFILASLFIPRPLPAQQMESRHDSLEKLIAFALANNPEIEAAKARWHRFEHKIIPAGSLTDPRLSLALSNYPVDSLSTDETPMTGNELQLSQLFPFPGKLENRKEAARQQALWYKGAYEDARLQLIEKVRDAWYRLYYQDRAIAITQENIDLLDDFIRLTETRYEVGEGLLQDVLKSQVERSKLMDRLFTLRQERESLLVEFNRLLGRPTGTAVDVPPEIDLEEVSADMAGLQEIALTHRPLFSSYKALIDQYQAEKDLAELDYKPDFNVFAGYRQRDNDLPDGGTDFVSAGVSINLPIWREKLSEQVAEAESATRMARRQYADFRDQVFAKIHDSQARLEKNRTLVKLFEEGILPQARQTFEASLSAYQVGDVDFLSLLDSLLTLYRYEIDYNRAISNYQRSVAGLEAAAGLPQEIDTASE